MKRTLLFSALLTTRLLATGPTAIVPADLVFAEQGGLVAFEAEHFVKQELITVRAWHLTTASQRPEIAPDKDGTHVIAASGGAYIEALPDTRTTHGDPLVQGESFTDKPGQVAVLSYKVNFTTPGRYHVWARIYSTGSEDNGVHFGIDGTWPDSGRRWQTVKKNAWAWDSRQRTDKVHVGVPGLLYLDVDKAGEHVIQVSMREDGFELDKILLTTDPKYTPEGTGPEPQLVSGKLPWPFPIGENYAEAPAPTPTPEKPAPKTH